MANKKSFYVSELTDSTGEVRVYFDGGGIVITNDVQEKTRISQDQAKELVLMIQALLKEIPRKTHSSYV